MADMIESHGVTRPEKPGEVPRWRIFDDPLGAAAAGLEEGAADPDAIFGLDQSLHDLVMTIRAGARGLGPERRIVLLHGPVGSAKSTIARILKRGLEHSHADRRGRDLHVRLARGRRRLFPLTDEPGSAAARARVARPRVQSRLRETAPREDMISIQGELDPVSRFWLSELMARHEGSWERAIEHVRVRRFTFSESRRVGIGTFQPKDEKNQDSTGLTGDLNYRKIAEYGSDSDPRAFNFDGEFNVANRGMLEFVEVLKLDVAFLYDLLGASQEHVDQAEEVRPDHIDEVIIGHTNEPEYRKLQNNEFMEALRGPDHQDRRALHHPGLGRGAHLPSPTSTRAERAKAHRAPHPRDGRHVGRAHPPRGAEEPQADARCRS